MGLNVAMPIIPTARPGASRMMKNLTEKKGVASIEERRETATEFGVRMIACQMTMGLFDASPDEMIEEPEIGGAATYLEAALKSDINLFI